MTRSHKSKTKKTSNKRKPSIKVIGTALASLFKREDPVPTGKSEPAHKKKKIDLIEPEVKKIILKKPVEADHVIKKTNELNEPIKATKEIKKVKKLCGDKAEIIAKIESKEGVKKINDIMSVADGVMIARGDLGVEVPVEKIPTIQKNLIEKIRKKGIPSICESLKKKAKIIKDTKLAKTTAKKYTSFHCYNMGDGDIYPSKQCKKHLKTFLNKNKNASVFEVIGVVKYNECKILDKLKKTESKAKISKIADILERGLSRKRVIEGVWAIKSHMGKDIKTRVINYTIMSKHNKKGFIVRAYK